jgi:signal transduction histidine kinase
MRERLNALGGRLTAMSEKDGGFMLEASVPLPTQSNGTDQSLVVDQPPAPVEVDR